MSAGRQKAEVLLAEIENVGASFRQKMADLQTQFSLLNSFNQNHFHAAHAVLGEYIAKVKLAKDELEGKIRSADTLRAQIDEMKKSEVFKEFLEATDQEGQPVESTSTYNHLVEYKKRLEELYAANDSLETQLETQLADVIVVNEALRTFGIASQFSFIKLGLETIKTSETAVDNFHTALSNLFTHAKKRYFNENQCGIEIGALLTMVGLALVGAALLCACPPAGAVAIGALIGGCALTAGGLGTLFYKYNNYTNEPMVKIANAIENEEKRVLRG